MVAQLNGFFVSFYFSGYQIIFRRIQEEEQKTIRGCSGPLLEQAHLFWSDLYLGDA
jgi:hypothetical protein